MFPDDLEESGQGRTSLTPVWTVMMPGLSATRAATRMPAARAARSAASRWGPRMSEMRQLAADDRLEVHQVAGDAAGDGRGRVPVGAGEHEGRQALGVEGLGLGVEALDGAGEGVGAEQPHSRGHAV